MRVTIDIQAFLLAFTEWFRCWVVQQRALERQEEVRQVRELILVYAPPKGKLFTMESLSDDLTAITGQTPEPGILQDALVQLQRSGIVTRSDEGWTTTGN